MSSESVQENTQLYKLRHSLAHIMAQAVQDIRPGTKLGFGPAISDGFYYDFILPEPITDADFKDIEKRMKKLIAQNQEFSYEDLPYDDAMARIDDMGEPYKKEYAQELFKKHNLESLRFYTNGKFVDMCEGPHIENTKEVPKGVFKIRSVAGAYWRADSNNEMMTRIYAYAFETKDELDVYIKQKEEALKRDHKKLGKELEIFHVDDTIGKGLPLWLPNGTIIRDELEKLMKELEYRDGYKRVATPHITKTDLYYQTGHLPYYKDGIFPAMEIIEEGESGEEVKETYCLKPMNCPHHHKIYDSRPRSYRELPLRLAEYGHVYRYEDSGAVSGLLRVRGMCMNDAHIYCTHAQATEEFLKVMKMHAELYDLLGLTDYHMRFSTWDPEDPKGKDKYIDDPQGWEKAQNFVREAMVQSGLPFREEKGEAAFYGPKIDFQFKTVTGREETASTNQLDFGIPERLDLKYTGSDGQEHRPYIIHRAPAGTHERFVAFLIEHFAGAFPVWLSPVQVKFIVVSDKFMPYAEKLQEDLYANFVRAEVDFSEDSLNKKIRNNTKKKIPCLIVIGEREVENEEVTVRRYGIKEQKTIKYDEFKSWILNQITTRALKYDDL